MFLKPATVSHLVIRVRYFNCALKYKTPQRFDLWQKLVSLGLSTRASANNLKMVFFESAHPLSMLHRWMTCEARQTFGGMEPGGAVVSSIT